MAATKAQIGALYVGYFNRGADPEGLNYWLSQTQLSLVEIANSFAVQPEAVALYPFLAAPNLQSIPAIDQFITSIYQNVFERVPDAAGLVFWRNEILNGKPPGRVVVDIESGAVGDDKIVLDRKTEVSVYYAEKFALSGDTPWVAEDDIDGAREALDGSRAFWLSPTAVAQAKANVDALVADSFSETFDLTPGTDDIVGSSANDEFNAPAIQTGGVQLETLNTTDSLDGAGGRNTLTAQLIAPFVVPKLLANIQEVNIDGPPGLFLPFISPVIDVINADAIDTFRFRNPTQDITVNNLQTALNLIEILDDSFGGNDFTINHIGDALDGLFDVLQVNLENDGAGDTALNLNHASGGYDEIHINSGGPVDNFLELNASPARLIITGDGGASLTLRGDALNLSTLDSLDSTGLLDPAGLDARFFGGFPGDLTSIDTGEGPDRLVFVGGTAGNVTVNTNGGDDYINFYQHTGNVVLNAGTGDDYVEIDTTGNATAHGGDGDDYLEFDVTGAVNTTGGSGNDEFFFVAQPGGAVSFGGNDFADGGPGVDNLTLEVFGAVDRQLLQHGAGITTIESITHVGELSGGAADLLVNMAQAGSAPLVILEGTYSDDVKVTNLRNDQTIEVRSDIADDLDLTHLAAALEIFNIVINGGVTVGELKTAGFDPDVVNINSIGGGVNEFTDVSDVFGDLFITGNTDLVLGDDYANGYAFSIFPPGGFVDAGAFTGDLTIWAQGTVQTFIGGSGNDQFNGGGGDDQFDLSHGGSDTVRFISFEAGGGTPLNNGLLFQNIDTGFNVANDTIELSIGDIGLFGSDGNAAVAPILELNVIQNSAHVTGAPPVNFLLFTTAVVGAVDAQSGFDTAIGGGEVEVDGGVNNLLGAFYDQTNQQAVLFAIDAEDGGSDNNKIDAGDDVDVVAVVGMSYTDFLAIGSSLELIA